MRCGISSRRSRSARNCDLDHLEPVVEVFAEVAGEHHHLEIAVGGREDADVHRLTPVAAELRELAVLEDVEQLGLEGRLHLADFVEEQRAAVRLLELADPRGRRARERTLFVAEELAFEQFGRAARRSSLSRTAGCDAGERW